MKTLAITAIALVATTSMAFAGTPSTNVKTVAAPVEKQQTTAVELSDSQLDGVVAAGTGSDPCYGGRGGSYAFGGLVNVSGNKILSGNNILNNNDVAIGGIGILGTGTALAL